MGTSDRAEPDMLRVELPSGQIVQIDTPKECVVGGINWPLCALGIEVHTRCLPTWVRDAFPPDVEWLSRSAA